MGRPPTVSPSGTSNRSTYALRSPPMPPLDRMRETTGTPCGVKRDPLDGPAVRRPGPAHQAQASVTAQEPARSQLSLCCQVGETKSPRPPLPASAAHPHQEARTTRSRVHARHRPARRNSHCQLSARHHTGEPVVTPIRTRDGPPGPAAPPSRRPQTGCEIGRCRDQFRTDVGRLNR